MRTIVDLPTDQVSALAKYCESLGISRAEAVRRALADFLAGRDQEDREKAFGAWKSDTRDATAIVRELRDEWQS